jgi:cobyrinic acid a,c-diamide synthase
VNARGLIVSAPHSGAGKTIVTLAVLAGLKRRGHEVRTAKAGPDYIDAAFHAAATGRPSVNLDSWAMQPALLDALAAQAAAGADVLIIEGVMGLFDGLAGRHGHAGSTADLAAHFALPVLLVLDVAGQSQTAAAVVRGLATHRADVQVAGVVLNRVSSERHRMLAADAVAALGIPVLGAIPRDSNNALPERHLGLVQASELANLDQRLDYLATAAEEYLDLDLLFAAMRPLDRAVPGHVSALPPPGQQIALACDAAFSFMYPHILDCWRQAGAEIVKFSPLNDEPPPERCDFCWLPGGYPELYAGALASARRFQAGLVRFAQRAPVHGECGGYMALGDGLVDANGMTHAMAGLLGHTTTFAKRHLHLGYREARPLCASPIGPAGLPVRGHEFHYATLLHASDDQPLVDLADGQGRALGKSGGRRGLVSGTFFHAIAQATAA